MELTSEWSTNTIKINKESQASYHSPSVTQWRPRPTNGSENPGVQANLRALSGFSVTPPNVNMEPQQWGFGRSFSYWIEWPFGPILNWKGVAPNHRWILRIWMPIKCRWFNCLLKKLKMVLQRWLGVPLVKMIHSFSQDVWEIYDHLGYIWDCWLYYECQPRINKHTLII